MPLIKKSSNSIWRVWSGPWKVGQKGVDRVFDGAPRSRGKVLKTRHVGPIRLRLSELRQQQLNRLLDFEC